MNNIYIENEEKMNVERYLLFLHEEKIKMNENLSKKHDTLLLVLEVLSILSLTYLFYFFMNLYI